MAENRKWNGVDTFGIIVVLAAFCLFGLSMAWNGKVRMECVKAGHTPEECSKL